MENVVGKFCKRVYCFVHALKTVHLSKYSWFIALFVCSLCISLSYSNVMLWVAHCSTATPWVEMSKWVNSVGVFGEQLSVNRCKQSNWQLLDTTILHADFPMNSSSKWMSWFAVEPSIINISHMISFVFYICFYINLFLDQIFKTKTYEWELNK